VTLAWDPGDATGTTALTTGYNIRFGAASGTKTNTVDAGTNLTVMITGLEAGVTNYFVATAYGTSNGTNAESAPSNELAYAPPAPDIITLMITAMTDTSVSLAWTESEPAGNASYLLQVWPSSDRSNLWGLAIPGTVKGFNLDWLIQADTDYSFRIAGTDLSGTNLTTAWSGTVSCHTPASAEPPPPPISLRIQSALTAEGPWEDLTNQPPITITNVPPGPMQLFRLQIKRPAPGP
jgi:hypothetical protein